jgi:hypothetical protein
MGLFLCLRCDPSPPALDIADDGLTALVNVNVLNSDLLLALAAVPIQCVKQSRVAAMKILMSRSACEYSVQAFQHHGSCLR